ncbi:MAG: hypothetical protein JWM68_5747 [Verrucomicrobiales bacterium]|nr:hypothetical protein [Verrucomicrobiales bacterium]
MKKILLLSVVVALTSAALSFAAPDSGSALAEKPDANGWSKLFDGKTLSGWTAIDSPNAWRVEKGIVIGDGDRSHLFSPETYTNFEFKAEVKLNHSGNSGMYFRAAMGPGWPEGYEAQVENTSPDPQKTGSLYSYAARNYKPEPKPVLEQLVQDDTWWTEQVVAISNHIVILVNGKIVTDFVDEHNTFKSGHLAFQQHNTGSVVQYRNVVAKRLPSDERAAWAAAKKDLPEFKVPAK